MELKTITVGELRTLMLNHLNALPDNALVTFGAGDLSFNRLKDRGPVGGPAVMNLEFNEIYRVTMSSD
jgi:hypothetical protein